MTLIANEIVNTVCEYIIKNDSTLTRQLLGKKELDSSRNIEIRLLRFYFVEVSSCLYVFFSSYTISVHVLYLFKIPGGYRNKK